MQVPISQGYCNSFGEKAGACMLVKNLGELMIRIDFKDALIFWLWLSVGVAIFEIIHSGVDALIIDMITPAYWMLVMVLLLKFKSS